MKTASLNIDVDPLECYYNIHGLKDKRPVADPIFDIALPRFLDFCKNENIKATLFITAETINDSGWNILKRAVNEGHEIANHSFSHKYRLIKNEEEFIFNDLKKNHDIILEKTGYEIKGFRAPGYNTNPKLLRSLTKLNYEYDSSLLPSLSYYAAKWFLIKLKSIRGNKSESFVENFRDVKSRWKPYRTGKNIFDKGKNLLEFPMTTAFTVPIIGTSIIALPKWIMKILRRFTLKRDFINIELHGIDFADVTDSEEYLPIKNIQPDLKYKSITKLNAIKEFVQYYKKNGYSFITLHSAYKHYDSKEQIKNR